MLDRASTFADPAIASMLKTEYVPVAIDQAYQRRQQDTEGEFYRKIAGQGPRSNFRGTTQGFYVATAAGDLLLYNNNRDPARLRRLLRQTLETFRSSGAAAHGVDALQAVTRDKRYQVQPPAGGLVLRVFAKVLDGYEPPDSSFRRIFQEAVSRDNLWVSAAEHRALVAGRVPVSLQQRLARFHLVDNTRGEPPMWRPEDIRKLDMRLQNGRLSGDVQLETDDGARGYQAALYGELEVRDARVVRFDLVARGDFWGEGPYTRDAPQGRFPLAVRCELADGSDTADAIPPQGSRGWLAGYLPPDGRP